MGAGSEGQREEEQEDEAVFEKEVCFVILVFQIREKSGIGLPELAFYLPDGAGCYH